MKKIMMTVAAACFALSGAAHAATLNIIDGSAGTIPGGTATNEVIDALLGGVPQNGFFESSIGALGFDDGSSILVEIMGYEAYEMNTFATADGKFFTSPSGTGYASDLNSPLASWTTKSIVNDLFAFVFSTTGDVSLATVANGDDNNNDLGFANFFATEIAGSIWLFFDDGSGRDVDDDNHDDLVVRISAISPVPLPAGGLLLLTGFGALALRRRRKAA